MALRTSNLHAYGVVSTTLSFWTLVNAFRQRSNFYAAAVYLSKSNACMMILWNQGIFQTIMAGKLLQTLLVGRLRAIEVERLHERAWFAVTETLLALTIFRDEFDTLFVVLFVSLLFVKTFHWLATDRVEMMEQATHSSAVFHLRMVTLLSLLWVADVLLIMYAVESILLDGPTVMVMFASEYMIMLASAWSATMKYGLNVIDMRSEEPWEAKSIYIFWVELATDFFKLVTYVGFFVLISIFYGVPLNILRDVYLTLRSFVIKCRDLVRFLRATRNMNEQYPDATREEMDALADKTCIICRDDMEYRGAAEESTPAAAAAAPGGENGQQAEGAQPAQLSQPSTNARLNDTPKKLPCGHFFHFHCLRSWLERQQSCPTCRRSVLASDGNNGAQAAQNGRGPQPQQQAAQQPRPGAVPAVGGAANAGAHYEAAARRAHINLARNLGPQAYALVFPNTPFPREAQDGLPQAQADPQVPIQTGMNSASASPQAQPQASSTTATPSGNSAQSRPPSATSPPLVPSSTTASSAPAAASTAAPQLPRPQLLPTPTPTAIPSTSSPLVFSAPAPVDNPLARFSLPDLHLPSEAELLSSRLSSTGLVSPGLRTGRNGASTSRGTASSSTVAAPDAAAGNSLGVSGDRLMTLQRNLVSIRSRAAKASSGSAARAISHEGEEPGTSTPSAKVDQATSPEKVDDPTPTDDESLSPREAAARAVERRMKAAAAARSASKGKSVVRDAAPPTSMDAEESASASELPRDDEATSHEPPKSDANIATPHEPAVVDKSREAEAVPTPARLPRLIPLHHQQTPELSSVIAGLATQYPSLFSSSTPVTLADAGALDEMSASRASAATTSLDLGDLSRDAMRTQLDTVVRFQEELDSLAGRIRRELAAAPPPSGPVEAAPPPPPLDASEFTTEPE